MKDSQFDSLSKEQSYKGFSLCCKNSETHFKCAIEMAKIHEFGLANSHLILGVEESVKMLLLASKHFDIETKIASIQPYFNDHKIKHATGKEIYEAYQMIIIKFESWISKLLDLPNSLNEFKSNDWWKNANNNKNNGFYVGYINNKWIAPQEISEEEYLKSKEIMDFFLKVISLIKLIEVDEYKTLPF